MKTIMRHLRRIEAIQGLIQRLTEEDHRTKKLILDTMPVQEGDDFSYDKDYCGILAAAWVGFDPAKRKAQVSILCEMEDGETKIIYDVNPKLLRKTKKRRKTKKS